MRDEIHGLFREALPNVVRSEETVKEILGNPNNHILCRSADNRLVGVSVLHENAIYLLCVEKSYRNKGIGSELLTQSERLIKANRFGKVVLGAGKDYIMPGVPMDKNAHEFFVKRGYVHSWGTMRCLDMEQTLADFCLIEHTAGDTVNGITYRWAHIEDLGKILECLSDNESNFSPYYRNEKYYENGTNNRVLIAENNDEVLGTLWVGIETDCKDMGSLGLTATARKHRNKGIATTLVILGTKYLKDIGLAKAHLSYTYTDLINLYGRAGYKVCMEYFMGEKTV